MNVQLTKEEAQLVYNWLEAMTAHVTTPSPSELKVKKLLDKLNRQINKPKMKPASAKAKGREWQKTVAKDIAQLLNIEYNQQDDHCLVRSREMGQAGTDIVLRGVAFGQFPFDVECKNVGNISIPAYIEQATANETKGRDWLILIKSSSLKEPVAIISYDAFFRLQSKLKGG